MFFLVDWEFLIDLRKSVHFSNEWNFQIFDLFFVLSLRILNKDAELGVQRFTVDGNWERDLDWPDGVFLWYLAQHDFDVDEIVSCV